LEVERKAIDETDEQDQGDEVTVGEAALALILIWLLLWGSERS
jgi:hypothetical protein